MKPVHKYWWFYAIWPYCFLATAAIFLSGCKCRPVISVTAPVSMTNTVVLIPTNSISVHQDLTNTIVLASTNTTFIINSNSSPIAVTNFISITVTNPGISGENLEVLRANHVSADVPWGSAIGAITWRGMERLIIDLGAIIFGILGYKLYRFGIQEGTSKLDFKTKLFNVALGGTGPGIIFIGLGACILITALFQGGASESMRNSPLAQAPGAVLPGIERIQLRPNDLRQPMQSMGTANISNSEVTLSSTNARSLIEIQQLLNSINVTVPPASPK